MTPKDTASALLIEAIQDALSGCGITNGTVCAHIEPDATHHGLPGRILEDDETCPLLTPEEREALTQSILSREDMDPITGPAIVRAHGIAGAARKHLAEINLSGNWEHPDRTTERLGRYDGSV